MMSNESSQLDRRLRPLFFCPKILTFHKVSRGCSFGVNNYSPRRFNALLARLNDAGYSFVSLEEALTRQNDRTVAITFDDGYQHLIECLPMAIKRFGLKPTIFMPTFYLGQPNHWDYTYLFRSDPHLSGEAIGKLADLGVRFGSHGHRHVALTSLNDDMLASELAGSKRVLEELTGVVVDSISYPFGRCDARVTRAASKAGYRYGFTMAFASESDTPLNTGRYAVYGYDFPATILQKLDRGRLYRVERAKANLTNRLAEGTIILNKLRGLDRPRSPGSDRIKP